MLSTTQRFKLPKPATVDIVGPNTYRPVEDKPLYQQKVPFLTSGKQEPSHFNKSYSKSLIYASRDDMRDRRFGNSPSYTTPRKLHDIKDIPGPMDFTAKVPRCVSAFDDKDKYKRLRKLYVCKPPVSVMGIAPSVPGKMQKYGYFIRRDGSIVPVPPGDYDSTSGPAKYGPHMKKTRYDSMYRGTKFTKDRRKYHDIDPNIPGPANYTVGNLDFHRDPAGDEIREMARLMTYVPRTLEKMHLDLIRDGFPGPADFDTNKPICKKWPPVTPAPFVSGEVRFPDSSTKIPGPAEYTIEGPKYPVSKLNVPFSNLEKRFSKSKEACLAGPSDYGVKGGIQEKLEKSLDNSLCQAPFCNSAERVMVVIPDGPGPADYTVCPEDDRKKNVTCVFGSKSKRFPDRDKIRWRYLDLLESYDFLYHKKSLNVSNVPFNVKSKRKGFYDYNPSPPLTNYDNMGQLISKGYYIPKANRFPEKEKLPGPGDYLIHPLYSTSMYNAYKTYNIKLKEGVLNMEIRCHPRKTWADWAKELKKRKKLRWFAKGGKQYTHCIKDMTPYAFKNCV